MLRVEWISDFRDLSPILPAWRVLSANAAEGNLFYEPLYLIPALQNLISPKEQVRLLLLWQGEELVGLVPIASLKRSLAHPFSRVSFWRNDHCYLSTPLMARGYEIQVWKNIFAQCPRVLQVGWMSGDGPVARALQEVQAQESIGVVGNEFQRPVLLASECGEKASVSGSHRRDLARLERRLNEMGDFRYEVICDGDFMQAVEDFLALEQSGWKGREGTAMASNENDRNFFIQFCKNAAAERRLRFWFARLNGKAIAVICDFYSYREGQTTGSAFKIAFDEEFSKFRPGLLIHLHQMRSPATADRIDSCALPGSQFDRLWEGRRRIVRWTLCSRAFPEALTTRAVWSAKQWIKAKKSRAKAT